MRTDSTYDWREIGEQVTNNSFSSAYRDCQEVAIDRRAIVPILGLGIN
jgi:hypothetical protein